MGPPPGPAGPWQTRQYVSYRNRPRLIDSDVRVRGFSSRSAVCKLISGSIPVTGTVPGTGGVGRAYRLVVRRSRTGANHPPPGTPPARVSGSAHNPTNT